MASRCGSRERRRAIPRKNRSGLVRWSRVCEVVTAEPGRSFAFRTVPERLDPTSRGFDDLELRAGTRRNEYACHACVPDHQAARYVRCTWLYARMLPQHRGHASPDDAHTGRAESGARGTGLLGRERLAAAHGRSRVREWLSRRRSRARRGGRRPRRARSRATSARCSGT